MKQIITTLFLCLLTSSFFAQMMPVFDIESEDLYGYVFVQSIERADRKNDRFMVGLLDVNLNKVSESNFVAPQDWRLRKANFNGTHIYFEMISKKAHINNPPASDLVYHIYDLQENKVTDAQGFKDYPPQSAVLGSYAIKNKGFGIIIRDSKTLRSHFYAISNDNELLYKTLPFGEKKRKDYEVITIAAIKDNLMALKVEKRVSVKSFKRTHSFLLIDNQTGKTLKEISLDTEGYNTEVVNAEFLDNEILVYGDTYDKDDKIHKGKTTGIFMVNMDLNGKILKQQNRIWKDFQNELEIKDNGMVQKQGFIETHEFVFNKANKHVLVAGEYINGFLDANNVKDKIIMDFDENFQLVQVFEQEKPMNSLAKPVQGIGDVRKYRRALNYDYRFHNTLDNEEGTVFFYSGHTLGFFTASVLHYIISYKDGKFVKTDLEKRIKNWGKKEGLFLSISKPGYVLISTVEKNEVSDIRLEKVDF